MLLKLDQFSSLNVNMSIVNFGRKIIKLIYARKAIQLRRLRQIEAQRVFYYLSFQNLGPQPSHFRLGHLITTLLAITRLLDFWVTTLPYPTRNWKTTTCLSLTAKRLTASSWHYWQLPRLFSSTRVLQRRGDPISWKHFHGTSSTTYCIFRAGQVTGRPALLSVVRQTNTIHKHKKIR